LSTATSRDIRTILFTDVEGSTTLRTERGDDVAAEVLRAHETIVRDQVARHGGREVKALGDGFMLAFASVRAALACAVGIQRGLARHNRDHPGQELRVRVGVNAGEVTEEGGDLFGEAVNAAARIAATAAGGEVIVSRVVKELAGTIPGLSFVNRGAVPLKGFPEPGNLYQVSWQEEPEADVLHIRLLGDVDLRYGRERLHELESPRLQSLLAYLLLHRGAPQARQRLAFLLWPDSAEAQARTNLRQLLHHLRRALPDVERFLEITSKIIQWRPDAPVSLDVTEFELATERAAGTKGEAVRRALEEAAALYGGDLLPGCYEEWVIPERERLRQRNLEILERLATSLEEAGDYPAAIRYGEMLLRNDPLHEATYRRLMRLHSRGGERARALRVYHTCASVVDRELGVEPGALTRQAYADVLALESAPAATPLAPATSFGAPLVGRHAEWERCLAAWQEAAAGHTLLLLVTGEAGLGKTRLVEELERWCGHQGTATARTRAYAAEGRLAYGPVVEWLRAEALKPSLAKLEPVWLTEIARLLPELLSQHAGLPRPEPLTGGEQRQHLFEALARAVRGAQPILLVVDDLQWCDQETLEFLHYLVRFDPRAPMLVAATARPEEIGPEHAATALVTGLQGIERLVEIVLGPLDHPDVAALAEQLGEEPLSPDRAERLYRETEGNPLFVVETVRAGLLTGSADGPPRMAGGRPAPEGSLMLPPKVHSVIQTRLAWLSPEATELVALAATVGREFTYEVLAEASRQDEDTLVASLDELWRRRIVREHGLHAYDFSHDKLREVAYAGVGPARRRRLHRAVADALASVHAGDLGPVSGQLAAHYDRAGRPEQAIPCYRQAAEVAQRVFANDDALAHLTRALELLEHLPPGAARDEEELALREALGVPLVALRGYGAPATRDNYARAEELCVRLARPSSAPVLRGLAIASISVGELDRALELGHRLLELAESEGDTLLVVEGHYVLGVTTFWRGELTASREHFEQAIARYRPENHRAHVSLFAQDPKVVCLCRLALTLWYLGYPDDSARAAEESLALGEALGHPHSLAYALSMTAWLSCERSETERTEELARALSALCAERGLALWGALAEVWLGWVEARRGRPEAGAARISTALRELAATGQTLIRTYDLFFLAQALALCGQYGTALRTVWEALEEAERTGARYLEAELHRLCGELLLAEGEGADVAEAEAALRRALDVAHRQGARVLELRSAISLTRWLITSGPPEKVAEARRVLQQVVGEFPDASHTADLEEARELLHRLSDPA
jgi:DNA-binding SARP family transcriptional activator/class 3 adenylate cyclase/predicted ATPase